MTYKQVNIAIPKIAKWSMINLMGFNRNLKHKISSEFFWP